MVFRSDRYIYPWSELGVHTPPPPGSLQDSGWTPGYEPEAEYENWKEWGRDRNQNSIMVDTNKLMLTPPEMNLSDQIGGDHTVNALSVPYGPFNGLPAAAYVQNCRAYNHTLKRESTFFVINNEPTFIREFYNDTDYGIAFTDHPITLPANHYPDALCCDGDAVYLLSITNPSGTGAIHKISINPWGTTPVWSRTLTGFINGANHGDNTIIVAGHDHVAFLYRDTLDSYSAVGVLAKDNSTLANGSGNAGVTVGWIPAMGLCHAGGVLFFIITGTTVSKLCMAFVSNPTTSPPYLSWDLPTDAGNCATDGQIVVVSDINARMHAYDIATDTRMPHLFGFDRAQVVDELYPKLVFDGMRMWALWEYNGNTETNSFVVPVSLSHISGDHPDTPQATLSYPYTMLGRPLTAGLDEITTFARMCFADSCLWIILKTNDATSIPVRVPKLWMRY